MWTPIITIRSNQKLTVTSTLAKGQWDKANEKNAIMRYILAMNQIEFLPYMCDNIQQWTRSNLFAVVFASNCNQSRAVPQRPIAFFKAVWRWSWRNNLTNCCLCLVQQKCIFCVCCVIRISTNVCVDLKIDVSYERYNLVMKDRILTNVCIFVNQRWSHDSSSRLLSFMTALHASSKEL